MRIFNSFLILICVFAGNISLAQSTIDEPVVFANDIITFTHVMRRLTFSAFVKHKFTQIDRLNENLSSLKAPSVNLI